VAADHVNIMGNFEMIEDVVSIALGLDRVFDRIYSRIDELVDKVDFRQSDKSEL
jgi:hypothetical protein